MATRKDVDERFVAKCRKAVDDFERAHEKIDRALDTLVRAMRQQGLSWAQVGDVVGMSAQAAHQRWAPDEPNN
jgi:hypothetical protein